METNVTNQGDRYQLSEFKVLPRHVGVWEGDWIILDGNCKEIRRFKAVLTQNIVDNQWVQTNYQTYGDGQSETQNFVGTAVGEGQVQIESPDSPFSNYRMLGREHGDDIIIFKIWEKATGKLLGIETINLMSDSERVRSAQTFTLEGKLKGFLVIIERKVE